MIRPLLILLTFAISTSLFAAEPDWAAVEKHALDLLQQYVRIASINPPADTRKAVEFLQGELKSAGIESRFYESEPGKVNLLARLPGRDRTKKPLLLMNHMDVVPVDPKAWPVDPFGATIKDGALWGRGALDMKSVAIQQLTAFLLLKQSGIIPPRDIVFFATCDEETGGTNGARWMIDNHYAELDPEYVLDEGGFGSADVFAKNKSVFGISVADKRILWLKMTAKGIAGHGSQPIPENANDILLHAIERARAFPQTEKPDPIVAAMKQSIGEFAPNKFMNATQQNTASLTTLRSGVGNPPKTNVIPSVAEATIDFRVLPNVNLEEFLSEIKARVNDPRVTFEAQSPINEKAPIPSNTETPLYAAIKKTLLKYHPDTVVTPIIVPYGTDGTKFRLRGVPTYGFSPMLINQKLLATMHSDNEQIPIDQFLKGLHIYFDVLRSEY